MRRYFLLMIGLIFVVGCSRADSASAVQVQAWLESIERVDPNAKMIEVWCKGNIEESPGSGIWKDFSFDNEFSVAEVLESVENSGLEWEEIISHMINITKKDLAKWVAIKRGLTTSQTSAFTMSFKVEDLHCDGKPLRSPPVQIGKCPNDTNGCDQPPDPRDQPPPPLPPPGPGGGDF